MPHVIETFHRNGSRVDFIRAVPRDYDRNIFCYNCGQHMGHSMSAIGYGPENAMANLFLMFFGNGRQHCLKIWTPHVSLLAQQYGMRVTGFRCYNLNDTQGPLRCEARSIMDSLLSGCTLPYLPNDMPSPFPSIRNFRVAGTRTARWSSQPSDCNLE